jgi:hypothetical protein
MIALLIIIAEFEYPILSDVGRSFPTFYGSRF